MPSFRSYIDLLSVLGCVCVPSTVLGARIQQCRNQTSSSPCGHLSGGEMSKAKENVYSIATWMTSSVPGCPASVWD